MLSRREHLNVLLGLWGPRTRWTAAEHLPDVPDADQTMMADVERRAIERSDISLEDETARLTIPRPPEGFELIDAGLPEPSWPRFPRRSVGPQPGLQ